MKTQKIVLLGLLPAFILFSCLEKDEDFMSGEAEIKKVLELNNFQLDQIDRNTNDGLKVSNLSQFEQAIKLFKGETFDSLVIENILSQNNLERIPSFNKIKFEVINLNLDSSQKILCVNNWRQVYGRIGVGSGATWIDVSFQTGTGTGLIEDFDAVLGGLTFMTGLGKNNFVNSQIAGVGNNYAYSGIYSFSIKYVLFVEGIGDVWTSETKRVRIRVDGCSGDVSYSFIEI